MEGQGLITHLRSLGFTEMEAKIIVSLSEQGAMTGYEVAKKLGVSRSNVYAALQRLVDHGVILHRDGDPSHYTALQPEELTRILASRLDSSLHYIREHMPVTEADETSFYSIEGERAVIETVKRVLQEAKLEIIADVWPEDAALIREHLALAEARGVKVLWSIAGLEDNTSMRVPSLFATDDMRHTRPFAFIIDRKEVLVGSMGEGVATKALLTEHAAITRLVLGKFVQDLVLYEWQNEMGAEDAEAFNKRIQAVISSYFD
jgi:HTH-type transcriptional regulator, sugar sensing transcriptional regulator